MGKYPASLLDWSSIPNFSESEFDHVDLERLDESFVIELQNFRDLLSRRIYPSPVDGAFVRLDGSKTSRHYAVGRLSDAGDVFPECHIAEAFLCALRTRFGGIGIYLDTTFKGRAWPMLHLDLRPVEKQAVWIRETIEDEHGRMQEKYTTFYPRKDPAVLCEILKKLSEV